MKAQAVLQKCLQTRFLELQTKNPSFSLRAFAKKLDLSPSALSELLRGHRHGSRKLAMRLAGRLLLDPQETHELLKHFDEKKPRPTANQGAFTGDAQDYLKLTADQFQLISEWVHYAILSLIETQSFKSDADWIATRLGVSSSKVQACLELLLRLGLIEKSEAGQLARTFAKIHTPDDVFNMSLQKAHIADMELAKEALVSLPVELRDFTSVTLPTSPERMPEIKKLIRRFRDEATKLLESTPNKTEVYQMSVYLYPLTKIASTKVQEAKGEVK
jgi:uncharacterized protein (TIGR02147 family)